VTRSGIEWCQRRYGHQSPPFRFTHVDLANDTYNPHGHATAASFRFPSDDRAFDLVIATSVFTHLLPDETANYLSEIGRVLAPGGRLFSTWFVVDVAGVAPPPFQKGSRNGAALVADVRSPSAAVAYPLDHLSAAFGRAALTMDPVRRGSWHTPNGASLQDIIIARKP
jgi:SAM-dependent methyltransferase